MRVGDEVTITYPSRITESHVTSDNGQIVTGWCRVIPEIKEIGHVLAYKLGWFTDYWVVGLNSGQIVQVPA